jgi:hypothetical protein
MLFAAILSGSTGSSSALSTKWRRSFSVFPSIITKGQLRITVESLFLRSSRLCELCKPRAIKKKLKSPGYVFSPYELQKVAEEDDKFPRDAIIVRGLERFFVKNKVEDLIIGYALSYHIFFQCRNLFSDRFFFSLFREKDFIREVGSWGPAHSIYVLDVHTLLNKVDLKDLRCFLYPFVRADRDILRILESLVDREAILEKTHISTKGLSLISPLSVLISSVVQHIDHICIHLLEKKCPKFFYSRYDLTIFVCIPQGLEKDPTAYDDLFYEDILKSVEVLSFGISMEVCRPGGDPVNFRNGILSLDHENKPQVSITNKVAFFYKKNPPPWN